MAVKLYDGVAEDGLFNVQGKAFHAQDTINTARGTTVPTEINDVFTIFNNLTVDSEFEEIIGKIGDAGEKFRSVGGSQMNALRSFCSDLLIKMVNDDNPQPNDTFLTALNELIKQMEDNSESVDASTVTASVSADAGNTGDGVVIASIKRGDGRNQENMLAEDIEGVALNSGLAASIQFSGESSVSKLSAAWPKGSGTGLSVTATDAASSLLANGDMEDEDDVDNAPDEWVVSVGTIGTTIKMTDVEVQTVEIGGSPTGGHYLLHWTNAAGEQQTTDPLAHDASQATVQAALRELEGLENIDVATTGTSPNFTHTITFTGRGGNLNQLTSTNNLTGGTPTITHATTSDGTAQVFAGGKALELDSDGAELTTLNQRLQNLSPETAYGVSLWAIADVTPAAGVITLDLVDGIGGTVINDSEGNANSMTFNAADLTTSWKHLSDLVSGETVFRTPEVVPDLVYFRLRISTAVSSGTSVFVDNVAMVSMSELYSGGPLVAAFGGSVEFKSGDKWTITTTNDRAGLVQEWYNRNFDMAEKGLLLPSNSAGSETVPDTVVA